jgi:hypothetical protein
MQMELTNDRNEGTPSVFKTETETKNIYQIKCPFFRPIKDHDIVFVINVLWMVLALFLYQIKQTMS